MPATPAFTPPPYPFDLLDELHALAGGRERGAIDLSIGSPTDPTPALVLRALAASRRTSGYPPSQGTPELRRAVTDWFQRRFDVRLDPGTDVAACVGSKELIASLPSQLRLRDPGRDTVLYPQTSYPTYEMGAVLAGCRAVPYDRLEDVAEADAERALCVWVNTPSNPTGDIADLDAAARWGRSRGVWVLVDECYVELTWNGPPRTVLSEGTEGVVAVHSLSKRSNFAGGRAGFYAGDASLVAYLAEVRKHAGMVVPGPVQDAAVAALEDDTHVVDQRARYRRRLDLVCRLLERAGIPAAVPDGGFFVWARVPDGDGWSAARDLAERAGVVVSPGDLYGPSGAGHVRAAAVQPSSRLHLALDRLSRSRPSTAAATR